MIVVEEVFGDNAENLDDIAKALLILLDRLHQLENNENNTS